MSEPKPADACSQPNARDWRSSSSRWERSARVVTLACPGLVAIRTRRYETTWLRERAVRTERRLPLYRVRDYPYSLRPGGRSCPGHSGARALPSCLSKPCRDADASTMPRFVPIPEVVRVFRHHRDRGAVRCRRRSRSEAVSTSTPKRLAHVVAIGQPQSRGRAAAARPLLSRVSRTGSEMRRGFIAGPVCPTATSGAIALISGGRAERAIRGDQTRAGPERLLARRR